MIVFNIDDFKSFKSFDKIDIKELSDRDVSNLRQKAKYTYYKFFDELIDNGKYNGKVLDFDNYVCLISSSELNGFYIPDSQIVRCLCFVNGKCIVMLDSHND